MVGTKELLPPLAVIVDGNPSDYEHLTRGCWSAIEFQFCRFGNAALRLAEQRMVWLWMLNVSLPDMSGFDLLEMLDVDRTRSTVFLIDEKYCTDDERRALQAGAARYLCKPPLEVWMTGWRQPAGHVATSCFYSLPSNPGALS